jgi:signal transduction histidine kinase
VWAGTILRFYGGATFPPRLFFIWGIISDYAFSLAALGLLLTTFIHLTPPQGHSRIALILTLLLDLASLGLDARLWPYPTSPFVIAGQPVSHFDVWAAVWIASWLIPVIAAWLLTQQVNAGLPHSLYRNQVHYWLLVLVLFLIGGSLNSVHQPGQPGWQEAGVFLLILAALTGTGSIANSQLPNLQLALRRILSRLSGTLIIFSLTWLALTVIVRGVAGLPAATNPNLILLLAAALFAGLFTLIYRLVNELTRRLFLPVLAKREVAVANYTHSIGNLPEPAQLGQLFLRIIQSTLVTNDAWFFVVEDGPAGKLILRPLASLGEESLATVDFAGNNPFTLHLRYQSIPLVQYDIDTLSAFDAMPAEEKALLAQWHRVLFMPLHAGHSLVGVLALGPKSAGESYDRRDFELLQSLATQISPLLAQAKNLASLRQINDYVFQQNQALAREKQHLQELTGLYAQFIKLISTDLRRPFALITKQLQQLQEVLSDNKHKQLLNDMERQINELQAPIDSLITLAARIQTRGDFNFELIHLDEIAHNAIRNLKTMAEARRVRVEFEPNPLLPAVSGDARQLLEAVQHLLHNAIKFNKIGGIVQLDYGMAGSELYLRVIDTGVGIPKERLEKIWSGFTGLSRNGSRGTGLGLALTHFIIAAHGGHVEVQSKYGAGSVFSIYLPLVFEE